LLRVCPRQIESDLDSCAIGVARSEQGPDLGAGAVTLENAHAVARPLALGIELDDDAPVRPPWLPSHRHAPAASVLFEQAYVPEILGVQRRKVLPVEDVLPLARVTGLQLSSIVSGTDLYLLDVNSVSIDPGD